MPNVAPRHLRTIDSTVQTFVGYNCSNVPK